MSKAKTEEKEVKVKVESEDETKKEGKEVVKSLPEKFYLKRQVVREDEEGETVCLYLVTGEACRISKNSDEYKQYLKENK